VVPNYDRDRVYTSDMKKILGWYNTLQALDMLDFSQEEDDSGNGEDKNDASQDEKGEGSPKGD